jgi:hypothetical protein
MEFIDPSETSEEQLIIINARLNGEKYQEISEHFTPNLTKDKIVNAIMRAARGFKWERGQRAGSLPYLCPEDSEDLESNIRQAAADFAPMDWHEIIDHITKLKTERHRNGCLFLGKLKCDKLLSEYVMEHITPPSRPWLNNFVSSNALELRKNRIIDLSRIRSCTRDIIHGYFIKHGARFRDVPPQLIYGADETMLESLTNGKVVVPEDNEEALSSSGETFPHITAMLCHSITGDKLPPFILLSKLMKLPNDLLELGQSGQAWIGSSPKGWMNRDGFLLFVLHFINYISYQRIKLAKEIRQRRGLLILDGHQSRTCPVALQLLDIAGWDVLILPAHTTHLMQMFDVVLAWPFKAKFSEIFIHLQKNDKTIFESVTARSRNHAIRACISAWQAVCTLDNCLSAAAATGIRPYDPDKLLASRFICESPAVPMDVPFETRLRHRLNINDSIITDPSVVEEIRSMIASNVNYSHLKNLPPRMPYSDICRYFLTHPKKACTLLTNLLPFLGRDSRPIYFD